MSLAEYEAPYREIWNFFQNQENPDIKINVFSINEDTAAAHEAKVAGGYLPAIELTQEMQIFFDKSNYEMAVDLSEIPFDWWDRWQFDVKNAWSDLHGLPGPRSLDFFQGFVMTWQYNKELMDQAGLDPQADVKTLGRPQEVDGRGHRVGRRHRRCGLVLQPGLAQLDLRQQLHGLPAACLCRRPARSPGRLLAGQRQVQCRGFALSPLLRVLQEANDKGWIPPDMTTRQWEGDMEASYIAGKSVMMLHGPWVWDKALAAGSDFAVNGNQSGLPATPPAEGQVSWMQSALPPNIDNQWFIRAGNEETEYWDQTVYAWNWFFSPEAVPMRAQAEGRWPLYDLDEPLDLQGPQFQEVLKEIGTEGGKWADAQFEQSQTGNVLAGPYRIKGSRGRVGLGVQRQQRGHGRCVVRQDHGTGSTRYRPEELGRELRGTACRIGHA